MLETAAPVPPTATLPWPARALNATGGALRGLGFELVELDQRPALASANSLFATLHRVVTDELDCERRGRANLEDVLRVRALPGTSFGELCQTVHASERAYARVLPVVVQLNKQHHVARAVLRSMHRNALEELARVKTRVDPDGVLDSRTLERLGF